MSRQRVKRAVLSPGEVVRELRLKKGWTQAVLARVAGFAVSNLSNIESGRSRLGEDRAILLAEALGVKPEFLLFPNGFERADLQPKLKAIQNRLKNMQAEEAA